MGIFLCYVISLPELHGILTNWFPRSSGKAWGARAQLDTM